MNENKTNINWYPGHMAKTKRLISEKLNQIDVVYELVDARIPYSSKIIDIDNYTKNKPKLLIMTKYDLCDKEETKKWVKYYEDLGYKVICIDPDTNPSIIVNATKELMKEKNAKKLEKGLKETKTRVLVVGIPNAGKSTLINKLSNKKAVKTGNKPGVTKNLDWIRINEDLELLDTPGILWPKFENEE
ncbi:MAG: ribosome biogenesis GTPase YlqF, partial [Bacilli bacterium]|nr:ribosome biogenesis GTPase YlqF [Bacilli bacterium]